MQTPLGMLILVLITVIVFAGIAVMFWGNRRDKESIEASRRERELATIEEDVRATPFGGFCIVLLVLINVGALISYVSARTVFQSIEVGVSLIAGCILFGLGAALGRRRTYTIYRSSQREPY